MPKCHTCGNHYDKTFEIAMGGQSYTFDSFECAVHALAPVCSHCGVRVLGHGLEDDGRVFCCRNCAELESVTGFTDRTSG